MAAGAAAGEWGGITCTVWNQAGIMKSLLRHHVEHGTWRISVGAVVTGLAELSSPMRFAGNT